MYHSDSSTQALHLYSIQHPTLGFEPIAAYYSTPKAMTIWSLVFMAGAISGIMVETVGIHGFLVPMLFFGFLGA